MDTIRSVYNKMIKRTSTETLSHESETVKVELIVYAGMQLVHIYIANTKVPLVTKTLDITPNGGNGLHADLYNYRTEKSTRYTAKTKLTDILSEEELKSLGIIIGGNSVKNKRK